MKKYKIFDGFNNNLLLDDETIEAKNGADAVREVLTKRGIKYTHIKKSAGGMVKMMAHQFTENNGSKHWVGNQSWFEVHNGDSILC